MMHRRQSLRPRTLDIHSRIRIIRSDEDLITDDDEATGYNAKVTSIQELSEMMVDDQPTKPKRKKIIPIPMNTIVANYEKEVPADYILPTSYIKLSLNFQNSPAAQSSTTATHSDKVEVDLEVEDMEWLRVHPRYGELGDPRYQLSHDMFAKMLDALEKASALINPGVITLAEAEDIFAKQLHIVRNPLNKVTVDIYNFWVAKRQALKRPLLRRFWPQTPLNDTNPHLVFRPREKERYKLRKHRKNDMEGLRKLQLLRSDFERVRQLLDMVKQREKYKRMMVDFLDETRRQSLHEAMAAFVSSMAPRVPKIPSEEDREAKHKKKKKKKDTKKHRRDSMETYDSPRDPSFLLPSLGTDAHAALKQHYVHGHHSHHSMKSNTVMDVQHMTVPTFLELPRHIHPFLMATNSNANATTVDHHHHPSESSCSFPTYPPSTAQLHAAIFADGPPRFRCRGRIGRGGRLIVDRIPVYESWLEWEAPPYYVPSSSSNATRSSSSSTTANHYHHHHHAAAVAVAPPPKEKGIARARVLESISNMSDSEDEIVSVDVPPEEDKLRPLKYTLAI